MKRVSQLLPGDFDRVAVWRYDGVSDDEATVRATDRTELASSDAETFIARTQFTLADGSHHLGFCSPGDDSGLESLQPVIVTAEGLVYFWFSEPPSDETLRLQWARLGVAHEEVFPVYYRCTVPFDGRLLTGVIDSDDLTGAA